MTLLALAVGGQGLVDPSEPVLYADDEGLLRGRAAFETLRIYGGEPFRLGAHIDRLERSAARIGLPPVERSEFESLAATAVAQADQPEAVLRLLWTAGRAGGEPAALALVSALPDHLEALRARGIRLISLRGARADVPWLLGGVKSTSYAVNMAAEAEAQRRGADDAVFVDAAGIVLEGPVTNIWWRKGRTLFTPALELGVLAGVTRAVISEVAASSGYTVEEGAFPLSAMASADEAFTSSSVREVLPAVELDRRPLGAGTPGEAARALQDALRAAAAAARLPNSTRSR
jgi:4-amino-4-deoxychorismate lyase